MSRFELRWIRRHPLRWLRICWWHWTIAILLAAQAVVITDSTWEVVYGDRYWPIALGFASCAAAASALAPLEDRLQTFTAAVLLGVAASRATTYLGLWLVVDTSPTVDVLSQAFAIQWTVLGAVALRWQVISTAAGARMAAEAGRDDRGGG